MTRKITDRDRINWLQEVGAIKWEYEEINEGIFPDSWDSEVMRVAIDAAIRQQKRRRG